MSVQFGRWNFDSKPVNQDYREKVKSVIAPYGPDGGSSYSKDNVSILYHAFHTTKESRRELQPHVMASGAVITWDGRLDTRAELIRELRDVVTIGSTDVSIVAAAYERWDTNCFAMLIGDWALSVWNPSTRSLILAKDHIGTRRLYYSFDKDQVTWSTILDPLVLFAGQTLSLCEEYIAGWLSFFPAAHLTPYVGIHSVAPSSYVLIRSGECTVSKYWDFDPAKRIRYKTDAEYEEHFRTVFAAIVRRRLRSDRPILAELSGGMDSSSIVCMADTLIRQGGCPSACFETITYVDDSEPNWNETPFVSVVEERLGRPGFHLELGPQNPWMIAFPADYLAPTPASDLATSVPADRFREHLRSTGARTILSGIGGDEVLGGVPTPVPELADLLVSGRLFAFANRLLSWSLSSRKPLYHLFADTLRSLIRVTLPFGSSRARSPLWLDPEFARKFRNSAPCSSPKSRFDDSLPSFQMNLASLNQLRNQIACTPMPRSPVYQTRYPYLDRELLEFLFAIPREQVVRPGQRRSLMRRALRSVVPPAILDRKRKAFVVRGPFLSIRSEWERLDAITQHMTAATLGFVDQQELRKILRKASDGNAIPVVLLVRTLALEGWLHHLQKQMLLAPADSMASGAARSSKRPSGHLCSGTNLFSAEKIHCERR